MAFKRYPDGTVKVGGGKKKEGTVDVPGRKYPPGYVDPPWIQQRREFYIKRWEAQGKPATQWRRALALAIARLMYYHPPQSRKYRPNRGQRFAINQQWKKRTPEEREKWRERLREMSAKYHANARAQRERKAAQARGEVVERQGRTNMEGI